MTGPTGPRQSEDTSATELLVAELVLNQTQVMEGTRHPSRRPLEHGAAEDFQPRHWRLVRGLLRVSRTRGYSGCQPISRRPGWWAALYSSMEGRIVGDPVYQKETSKDLASPPRNRWRKRHVIPDGNRPYVTLGPSGVYINQRV